MTRLRVRRAAPASCAVIGVALACAACEPRAPSTTSSPAAEASWETLTDAARGIELRYPADLGTTYIRPVGWPPAVEIATEQPQCAVGGDEIAASGRTERVTLGGRSYCVTRQSEGAAGSVYTTYRYAFEHDGRTATLSFTARAVQCGNYDDPAKRDCETERADFDASAVVDAIARTLELRR